MRWAGLQEFRADLRQIPAYLTDEARGIVTRAASEAQREAARRYPIGKTGNLRRGLRIRELHAGAFGAVSQLYNAAPHGYFFEHGTKPRYTARPKRFVGRMPEGNVLIPAAIAARRRMYRDLAALLTRTGFVVRGVAA